MPATRTAAITKTMSSFPSLNGRRPHHRPPHFGDDGTVLAADQHDPTHRPTAGALDAGEQLHLPCPAAAAVVPHPVEDVADQHVALRPARLGKHPLLAAPVAGDPQEPTRKRGKRFGQRFGGGGWATDRCRKCASAASASRSILAGSPAHDLAELRLGGIASPPVLLWRHVGHVAEPARPALDGDDRRPTPPEPPFPRMPVCQVTASVTSTSRTTHDRPHRSPTPYKRPPRKRKDCGRGYMLPARPMAFIIIALASRSHAGEPHRQVGLAMSRC
jgi:hypothetical protein